MVLRGRADVMLTDGSVSPMDEAINFSSGLVIWVDLTTARGARWEA